MSNMYQPGPSKKLVFSLYGGSARASRLLFGIFIAGQTGGNFEGLVGISGEVQSCLLLLLSLLF